MEVTTRKLDRLKFEICKKIQTDQITRRLIKKFMPTGSEDCVNQWTSVANRHIEKVGNSNG